MGIRCVRARRVEKCLACSNSVGNKVDSANEWFGKSGQRSFRTLWSQRCRFSKHSINSRVFQLRTIPTNGSIDQSGTNIEAAVDSAVQTFPPHHLKRLVLVTDGNENSGHMMNMLTRA